ncbi:MAG TPA: filamentous hemagglutinin family protein, partial [Isosphaeraceae bacterium]|nr:filamentous hemagglutinin family protein [Isosphaeraceae bacterium]
VGVAPGDVDLIAPAGTIDAGDAGIRASGNVSVAALHIVNATNIQASGTTSGVPVVAAPNIGGLTTASSTTAASASAASDVATRQQSATQTQEAVIPSLIDVEVLGYGGGDDFPT